MNLTLLRHTSLDAPPGTCYGQTDYDVSSNFSNELESIVGKISGVQFDAIYSSPLIRCRKLANRLLAHPEVISKSNEVEFDSRIKELNFGDWESKAWQDIPQEHIAHWADNYVTISPPNGETFLQLQQRAKAFLRDVLANYDNGNCLVITHAGVIRALVALALEVDLTTTFKMSLDYSSATKISYDGEVSKIQFFNI